MNVTVVAFENCMTSAVFGLLDAFDVATRYAGDNASWNAHAIRLATPTGGPVRGSGGHSIQPQCSIADARDSEVVIVPAILGDVIETLGRERGLIAWLASLNSGSTLLASACTGAFFLAEANVLNERVITTNPFYGALFRNRYPRVGLALDRRISEDRNVICAGSTTAVLDLAVYLIDKLGGHELAVMTAKALSIDKNAGSQRPYLLFVAPRDHGDERVLRTQEWIEANHRAPIGLKEMIEVGNMSARNLTRRFQSATGFSPIHYLRAVRVESAKRLLETRNESVDSIATAVGYGDVRGFTRAFKEEVGVSPAQYRQRFSNASMRLGLRKDD